MSSENVENGSKPTRKRTPETGHARNIGSFEKLISLLSAMGDRYQPANQAIDLKALMQRLQDARTAVTAAIGATTHFDNVENERSELFRPLRRLSTRVVNAFIGCGVGELSVKDAQTINRKLQGVRSPGSVARKDAIDAGTIEGNTISASQQSVDQKMRHFKALRILVTSHPEYRPNEEDLHPEGLEKMENRLESTNTGYQYALSQSGRARQERDRLLYADDTGMVALARMAKAYAKSVLGSNASAYTAIGKLSFKDLRPRR